MKTVELTRALILTGYRDDYDLRRAVDDAVNEAINAGSWPLSVYIDFSESKATVVIRVKSEA